MTGNWRLVFRYTEETDTASDLASAGRRRAYPALRPGASLFGAGMVARASPAGAEDAPAFVADHGLGARLPSIHTQEKSHGSRTSCPCPVRWDIPKRSFTTPHTRHSRSMSNNSNETTWCLNWS